MIGVLALKYAVEFDIPFSSSSWLEISLRESGTMIVTSRRHLNISKILAGLLVFYAGLYFLWQRVSERYIDTNWPFISQDVLSDDILAHTQNETLGVSTHIPYIAFLQLTQLV